jgi:hypothetical protein
MTRSPSRIALGLGALALTAGAAQADPAAASRCRAGLSPEAARIYDAVLPQVTPQAVIRDVLRQQVRALVTAGQVRESTARDSAMAAGACFQALRG